jgi:hypothetical protein
LIPTSESSKRSITKTSMIVKDSILYARCIDPMSGKLEKRDTFLGAALKFIGGVAFLIAMLWVIIQYGAFVQRIIGG